MPRRLAGAAKGPSPQSRTRLELTTCLVLALHLGLTGCITTPLEDRSWALAQTSHYEIVSSLGEEATETLALEVERFRQAAEFALGRRIPAAPLRTRIYAFDGRSIERPFAMGSQSNYLLRRMRGDVIVLRGGGGWNDDAGIELQLHYARRLFRSAGSLGLPLWYDEGFAQLASTLQVHRDRADVGILREDHVRLLREKSWIDVRRILSARSLEGWSTPQRDMFEAESWALAHYLKLGGGLGQSDPRLAHYLARLREGDSLTEAARQAFGGQLNRAVPRHIREQEFDSVTIGIEPVPEPSDAKPRALSRSEVLEELGNLSNALDRSAQAREYFEAAASAGGGAAHSAAGIGVALTHEEDWELAEKQLRRAANIAPNDPFVQLDLGNTLLARAGAASDSMERGRLIELARERYARSQALRNAIPETHSMLAVSYLIEGRDAARGIAHSDAALALLPASLEIRLVRARLMLMRGNLHAARIEAIEVLSRGRSRSTLDAARGLLTQIEGRSAQN
jgi:tetratricopeptide (TPR) repeat protein